MISVPAGLAVIGLCLPAFALCGFAAWRIARPDSTDTADRVLARWHRKVIRAADKVLGWVLPRKDGSETGRHVRPRLERRGDYEFTGWHPRTPPPPPAPVRDWQPRVTPYALAVPAGVLFPPVDQAPHLQRRWLDDTGSFRAWVEATS